jgi:hypothetical protein
MAEIEYVPNYSPEASKFLSRIDRRRRCATKAAAMCPDWLKQKVEYDLTYFTDYSAVAFPYVRGHGVMPDFKRPSLFNEKVRAQFLRPENPLVTIACDKIAVRKLLAFSNAAIKSPPLIAIASSVDEFAKEISPHLTPGEVFVKANHGCRFNQLWDRGDRAKRYHRRFEKWLSCDFWRKQGEMNYRKIRPKLLVEKRIPVRRRMAEYKVHCFHGKPQYISVIVQSDPMDRATRKRNNFYPDWTEVPFSTPNLAGFSSRIERPSVLDLVLTDAERISRFFFYARIDFLHFDESLNFSEVTIANCAGALPVLPFEWNKKLGDLLDMSKLTQLEIDAAKIARKIRGGG